MLTNVSYIAIFMLRNVWPTLSAIIMYNFSYNEQEPVIDNHKTFFVANSSTKLSFLLYLAQFFFLQIYYFVFMLNYSSICFFWPWRRCDFAEKFEYNAIMFEQKDLKALHMILFCNGGLSQWPHDELLLNYFYFSLIFSKWLY